MADVKVVAVESNIAAGKSTLLHNLRKCPTLNGRPLTVVEEPLDQIGDLLRLFYSDQVDSPLREKSERVQPQRVVSCALVFGTTDEARF